LVIIKKVLLWCTANQVSSLEEYKPTKCRDNKSTLQRYNLFNPAVFVCLFLARQPPVGHGLLIHEVSRSHNDATQSVALLWTSDQLVAETSTWQHATLTTNIHAPPVGFEPTHILSRPAAVDLRLRPSGHWDRPTLLGEPQISHSQLRGYPKCTVFKHLGFVGPCIFTHSNESTN